MNANYRESNFNLSDITIEQFLGNFFDQLEQYFTAEFVQQTRDVIKCFDNFILNDSIVGAQGLRDAFVLGAQIEQSSRTQPGILSDRIISAMNNAIEEYFSFQGREIPSSEAGIYTKRRIKGYSQIINDTL